MHKENNVQEKHGVITMAPEYIDKLSEYLMQ